MNAHAPVNAINETTLRDVCDDAELEFGVARALWRDGAAFRSRSFTASTPGFKQYDSDELGACRQSSVFPAFSITGGACALDCAHCRAKILEPMIAAGAPVEFEKRARAMIEGQGMRGFLLSGGSSKRNEVGFDRYLPVIKRIKHDYPETQILVHTGLVTRQRADNLAASGADVAMLDIIGAPETVREVYNLDRPVADFENSLAALIGAGMNVVPHIVVGLHFGRLRGEAAALAIIARHRTQTAILVVLMHGFADQTRFTPVDPHQAGAFFGEARAALADRRLLLGCARPHGRARIQLDYYAALAGFDGIAFPSDGVIGLVRALGRSSDRTHNCCGGRVCGSSI